MSSKTDLTPIAVGDFKDRCGINLTQIPGCEEVEVIVSPRDITVVKSVIVMPDSYRNQLLYSIGLIASLDLKAYKNLEIHLRMVDPSSLMLGQKYVYRPNYTSIVEGFRDIFKGFGVTRGFTRLSAYLLVGTDSENRMVLGHYLPPIVEAHDGRLILMDGVHRTYLARQAGVSIECLVVENVEMKFPCAPHPWRDVRVIEEKPPRAEERYWDLNRSLFRDVKSVGIDG